MQTEATIQDPFLDGLSIQSCKKCHLPIYEGHAYELGDDRWHINCFKCSKCDSSLGCNSNFLVLGNGNLICSNCSYNCKQCGKKIDDLAILTGDQAYCSSCFKCRACKQKIEDLRYARTSKGLFCMNCHEKLMAKKRKYDLKKKKLKEQELNKENILEKHQSNSKPSTPDLGVLSGIEEEEKPLFQPKPYVATSSIQSQSDFYDLYDRSRSTTPKLNTSKTSSFHELHNEITRSSSSLSKAKDLPLTPDIDKKAARKSPLMQFNTISDTNTDNAKTLEDSNIAITAPTPRKPIEREFSIEEINDSDDELNNRANKQENVELLQPAVQLNNFGADDIPTVSHTKFQGKNLLILSPGQSSQHEELKLHSPESTNFDRNGLHADQDIFKSRSNCPSPLAKANRHARVMEAGEDGSNGQGNDGIELDLDTKTIASSYPDPNSELNTPKKGPVYNSSVLSSPPPRAPLPSVPSVPSTPNGTRTSETSDQYFLQQAINNEEFLNGLGLEGIEYNDHNNLNRRRNSNPSQTRTSKINGSPIASVTRLDDDFQPEIKKSSSIRTPKVHIRHKRSISGGSNGSISKLNIFRSKDDKGHNRNASDGSNVGTFVSNIISPGFTTASHGNHNRSSSETSYVNHKNFEFMDHTNLNTQTEFELKAIKFEISNLEMKKTSLTNDVKRLQDDKQRIMEEIQQMRLRYNDEYRKLSSITKEVNDYKQKRLETESKSSNEDSQSHHSSTPTQSKINSHYTSNSSSSLINTPDLNNDDGIETQKATKLKFWRRAKIGFNNISGPTLVPPANGAGGLSPYKGEEEERKGFGIMPKSISTNILDTFLNPTVTDNSNEEDEYSLFKCNIDKRSKFEGVDMPLIVSRCIQEVEDRGLDMEGIYRISGGNLTIIAIEQAFTNLNPKDEKSLSKLNELLDCDINAITSTLKRYLRKIPNPLIPFEVYNEFIRLNSIASTETKTYEFRSQIINRIPTANRIVLYKLCKHLELVNSHSNINRMNYKNLSVVFAPTIARDETGQREMMDMGSRNDMTEFLLINYAKIF